MDSPEARKSYLCQIEKRFLENTSTREDNQLDRRRLLVCETLLDAFSQTLAAMEGRFMGYVKQLIHLDSDDSQLIEAKKYILAAEKSIQTMNFHKEGKQLPKTPLHMEAIKNCFTQIRDAIDLQNTTILDQLVSQDILSVSDEESVRGRGTRKGQNEELLGCLVGSLSVEKFNKVFLPALDQNYPYLVDYLLTEMERLETEYEESVCIACRTRRDVKVKRIATSLLSKKHITYATYSDLRNPAMSNSTKWAELTSLPDSAIIDALEVKYPVLYTELKMLDNPSLECRCVSRDGDVGGEEGSEEETSDTYYGSDTITVTESLPLDETPFDKFDLISPLLEDPNVAYKMTARPRGICLIINNTEIKGHRKRSWSDRDQQRLERVYNKLEFTIVTRTNLKAKNMISTMVEFASMNHKKHDAFVCCILTQGNEEGLYGYDGKVIKESKLTSPFKASSCPSLAGKPKMFFFQANRKEVVKKIHRNGTLTPEGYVADDVDFLYGYCTSPESDSFADDTGSAYIRALTRVLDKYSDSHDLLACLRMVNRSFDGRTIKLDGSTWCMQVPAPLSLHHSVDCRLYSYCKSNFSVMTEIPLSQNSGRLTMLWIILVKADFPLMATG